jgi:cobalt-zinc-cadmium efflux system outer membrane protein
LTLALVATLALALHPPGRAAAQGVGDLLGDTTRIRRISLDEALERLGRGNLDLRLARQEVTEAEARVVSAGTATNPGIVASHEQLGDGGSYDETILSLAQTVEIGGQRGLRRSAARLTATAAETDLLAERARLAFAVHRAYVRAAGRESDLAALAEAAAVVRQVEASGSVRFAEGDVSRFERSRLQIERARYETLLSETGLAVVDAGRELAMLLAPDSVSTGLLLLPSGPLPGAETLRPTLTLDSALLAASARAEVRAADARVEAMRTALALQRRERLPDVTLSAGYKRQADGLQGAVLGVSVPIPLRSRNEGAVAEAQAALDAALVRREIALRQAEGEIRRAWDTVRFLDDRTRVLAPALLPASTGLLETAGVAYAEGEMSLVELLDAADAYRSARETANRLLADYLLAVYDLERATGRLLDVRGTSAADSAPDGEVP